MLLPLHSFAVQGGWLTAGHMYDLAHEAEHLEGTNHHHSDDGSVHYDDSGESAKHFSEHSASQQTPALPSVVMPQLTLTLFSVVRNDLRQYIPDPDLERPQRPPSTLG